MLYEYAIVYKINKVQNVMRKYNFDYALLRETIKSWKVVAIENVADSLD